MCGVSKAVFLRKCVTAVAGHSSCIKRDVLDMIFIYSAVTPVYIYIYLEKFLYYRYITFLCNISVINVHIGICCTNV